MMMHPGDSTQMLNVELPMGFLAGPTIARAWLTPNGTMMVQLGLYNTLIPRRTNETIINENALLQGLPTYHFIPSVQPSLNLEYEPRINARAMERNYVWPSNFADAINSFNTDSTAAVVSAQTFGLMRDLGYSVNSVEINNTEWLRNGQMPSQYDNIGCFFDPIVRFQTPDYSSTIVAYTEDPIVEL